MANIKIEDLRQYTVNDTEIFIQDLSDDELVSNRGGWSIWAWLGLEHGGSAGHRC